MQVKSWIRIRIKAMRVPPASEEPEFETVEVKIKILAVNLTRRPLNPLNRECNTYIEKYVPVRQNPNADKISVKREGEFENKKPGDV
jgi:hypothetical protein